jgi:hypothetical protein
MQVLKNYEKRIFTLALPMIDGWRREGININQVKEFNKTADDLVKIAYSALFNL